MTPKELKQIAFDATKIEYENILNKLKQSAENGALGANFDEISEGAICQLKIAGFDVLLKTNYSGIKIGGKSSKYFEVKF